jgi:hypothetical protein
VSSKGSIFSDLPHIILTSDHDWDPSVSDNDIDVEQSDWYTEEECQPKYGYHPFSSQGRYKNRVLNALIGETTSINVLDSQPTTFSALPSTNYSLNPTSIEPIPPDYSQLQPKFGCVPIEIIAATFKNTTQLARILHLYGEIPFSCI